MVFGQVLPDLTFSHPLVFFISDNFRLRYMGCDFSFIHCADLHLGSRAWGVPQRDKGVGDRFYESTFRSFSRILDIGLQRADFMVIAGDVYDELYETPRTRLFFASELKRFGKPCFVVTGNHDAVHSWSSSIPYPDNVIVFGTEPSSETLNIRGRNVEITGVSFEGPHTDENLVLKLHGEAGFYSIGVVHCSVGSGGNRYAPCNVEDLLGRDIQYWALGHIHKRTTVHKVDPVAIYPGNIQGRDISEAGEKGCILVSVSGNITETEFIPTQEILWDDIAIDISGIETMQELIKSTQDIIVPSSIVGLTVRGRGRLNRAIRSNPNAITDSLSSLTNSSVFMRSIECLPELDLKSIENGQTLMSETLRSMKELESMSDQELLNLLCSKGPASDIRVYLQYFADKGKLHELVTRAGLSVIDRLSGAEE